MARNAKKFRSKRIKWENINEIYHRSDRAQARRARFQSRFRFRFARSNKDWLLFCFYCIRCHSVALISFLWPRRVQYNKPIMLWMVIAGELVIWKNLSHCDVMESKILCRKIINVKIGIENVLEWNLLMEVLQFAHLDVFIVSLKRYILYTISSDTLERIQREMHGIRTTQTTKCKTRQTIIMKGKNEWRENVPNLSAQRTNEDFVNTEYIYFVWRVQCAVDKRRSLQPDRFMCWTRLNLNSIINFKEI